MPQPNSNSSFLLCQYLYNINNYIYLLLQRIDRNNYKEILEQITGVEDNSPLSLKISERLDSPIEKNTEIKEYYYNVRNSIEIPYHNIIEVTFIDSIFLSRSKTLSIIIHDMTSQLKRENERAEQKLKNMLLFSLSHELKTPLNILQVFLNVAKSLPLSCEHRESLKMAKASWILLNNKINFIMYYAQHISHEFSVNPVRFSLRTFLSYIKKTIVKS